MANLTDYHEENALSETLVAREIASSAAQAQSSGARLGVVIGGQKVLIPLTDISEVLPVPQLQVVPLTKVWYLGVANVRGTLFSVTDLAQFLGWPMLQKNLSNRIVLLNSVKTTQAAIAIDSVIGLRNVESMQTASNQTYAMDDLWPEGEARCFSSQLFLEQDQTVWLTLDVDALVQNPKFVHPGIA